MDSVLTVLKMKDTSRLLFLLFFEMNICLFGRNASTFKSISKLMTTINKRYDFVSHRYALQEAILPHGSLFLFFFCFALGEVKYNTNYRSEQFIFSTSIRWLFASSTIKVHNPLLNRISTSFVYVA